MDRSEALEEFVTDKLSQVIAEFNHSHDAHAQVWLVSELNRATRGVAGEQFVVEIEVRTPGKHRHFISKTANDIYLAIGSASDALKVLLDEAGKRQRSQRHDNIPAQPSTV
jgi:ribosome-associated translation inhibitor RaiA